MLFQISLFMNNYFHEYIHTYERKSNRIIPVFGKSITQKTMKETILKGEFALICTTEYCIVLDTVTNRMFRIKEMQMKKNFIKYFKDDINSDMVKCELDKAKSNRNNATVVQNQLIPIEPQNFQILKLVLVLTSKCNLKCKYCYAHYGMYDFKDDSDMSEETLINGLDYLMKNFKGISKIQFFGGEPTLREDLIISTVKYFDETKKSKPKFGMITNGICMSENLIDLMSNNNFNVTISLDGPCDINDLLRVNHNNKGSFRDITLTYQRLNQREIPVSIETTYTAEHILNGISLVSLVNYFAENFSCAIPHIVPVSIDINSNLSLKKHLNRFGEYIDELVTNTFDNIIINNKQRTIAIFGSILNKIITHKSQETICPAGLHTFSIAKDNKISPCFLYTSKDEISYGNIGDNPQLILNKALQFNKTVNCKNCADECKKCFAKGVCSSCLGSFDIESEKPILNDDVICFTIKRLVEKSYIRLAEIYADDSLKEKFERNMFN